MSLKAAILGGTSHIARAITPYLLKAGVKLTLFARSPEKLAGAPCRVCMLDEDALGADRFDIIINCIGAGTPKELAGDYNRWFSVLGAFDDLALRYLREKNPSALYVFLSSGAVYGRKSDAPADENTVWQLLPDKIEISDYYGIAKLYSEARHRSLPRLRIADLRIFSFFSRYAALDSGYFMTDLVTALLKGETFATSPVDIVRDYPHPSDLAALILRCGQENDINRAVNVASSAAISKFELLKVFEKEFDLKYRIEENGIPSSPNGSTHIYLPTPEMAEKVLSWRAEKSSLDTLLSETKAILDSYGNA